MDQIPIAGEYYRHFKDRLYQIITVAIHSETEELMVVYQPLEQDKTYVRPLEMFCSDVDKEKYPNVKQQKRFERVELDQENPQISHQFHPLLMVFLDESDVEKKFDLFQQMRRSLSQRDLFMIYTSLDIREQAGTVAQQCESVEKQLLIRKKYSGTRLR